MVPYRIGKLAHDHVLGEEPWVITGVEGRGEQAVLALVEPDDEDVVQRPGHRLAWANAHQTLMSNDNLIPLNVTEHEDNTALFIQSAAVFCYSCSVKDVPSLYLRKVAAVPANQPGGISKNCISKTLRQTR